MSKRPECPEGSDVVGSVAETARSVFVHDVSVGGEEASLTLAVVVGVVVVAVRVVVVIVVRVTVVVLNEALLRIPVQEKVNAMLINPKRGLRRER